MPVTVRQLVECLDSFDPDSIVGLAVEGFKDAPLSPRIIERNGTVLLHLSAESELAEVLTEIDIVR